MEIRISGEANDEARSSLCDLSVETARFISYGKDKELHKIDKNRETKDVINDNPFGVRKGTSRGVEAAAAREKFIYRWFENIVNREVLTHENAKVSLRRSVG